MKILLAVAVDSDPIKISHYIGKRFKNKNVYIDILTVIPKSELANTARDQQLHRDAMRVISRISCLLRDEHNITGTFSHIEFGDPSKLILSLSKRWRSSLILIEAPKCQGMLTAFRKDGVSLQLFQKAQCSLELIRAESNSQDTPLKVLIPLHERDVDRFDFSKLNEFIRIKGAQIRLLSAIPEPFESLRIEANAAALLMEQQDLIKQRAVLEGKLSALCNRLTESLDHQPDIDFSICEGDLHQTVIHWSENFNPSLIVMQSEESTNPIKRLFSSPNPVSFAVATGFSVLLVRDRTKETNIKGRLREIFNPAFQES